VLKLTFSFSTSIGPILFFIFCQMFRHNFFHIYTHTFTLCNTLSFLRLHNIHFTFTLHYSYSLFSLFSLIAIRVLHSLCLSHSLFLCWLVSLSSFKWRARLRLSGFFSPFLLFSVFFFSVFFFLVVFLSLQILTIFLVDNDWRKHYFVFLIETTSE